MLINEDVVPAEKTVNSFPHIYFLTPDANTSSMLNRMGEEEVIRKYNISIDDNGFLFVNGNLDTDSIGCFSINMVIYFQ